MLLQLRISNFAIIKQLELTLGPGLNILSGETGAGKSIIINAMNLILGGRASSDLIRTGCKEARVEALFTLPGNRILAPLLSEMGFSFNGELLIKRSIFREGRNRILINDSMATLQSLSRLGSILISISGQHEHQLVLNPENHIYILDDFGGLAEERHGLNAVYAQIQALQSRLSRLKGRIEKSEEEKELARFQIQEIERAEVVPGEDQELAEEKRRLQHAESLLEIAVEGYETLYEQNSSVFSMISQSVKRMDKGVEIDSRLRSIRDSLADVKAQLEDTALALRDFKRGIHLDPRMLEEVVERLELIHMLKRKYGPSLEDVLRTKERLAAMMVDLDEHRGELDRLNQECNEREAVFIKRAEVLSRKRKEAAEIFKQRVEEELHSLHMEKTRFQVSFDQGHGDPKKMGHLPIEKLWVDGFDRVQYLISPNVGEELRPLSKIASGGELSRFTLALKTILAKTASVETLIFDEVDSGISGATAEVVGEKLLSLANYHQILCITHLPQIASHGQTHYLVKKAVLSGRTQTAISELDPEERVHEIARLLGGREVSQSAVEHAREMLR